VLVVEDEPAAAEALALHVGRVPGFVVSGVARTGAEALRRVAGDDPDLVLLDIGLPDVSGLEVLRRLRAAGRTVDVLATTRARDLAVVRAAVAFGVTQYLLKPFTATTVREKLERHAAFLASLRESAPVAQDEVDGLLGALRPVAADDPGLPKGISRESLRTVVAALRALPAAGSAAEIARALGMSRVTTRRYLEYLVDAGLARREARYGGGSGRPELEYRWEPLPHGGPGID
jgi:response regulator of citrate/malate metabolism